MARPVPGDLLYPRFQLALVREQILTSQETTPDDVDGRLELYRQHAAISRSMGRTA